MNSSQSFTLSQCIDRDARHVFTVMTDMEVYAKYMASVQKVEILERTPLAVTSVWTVLFNGGTMQWTELDEFDHDAQTIGFKQLEGDLERFSGEVQVKPTGPSRCEVAVTIEFDLGIPELSGLLNPYVEDTLRENFREMLQAVTLQAEAAS